MPVQQDWAIFGNYIWQIFILKQPKHMVALGATLKSTLFRTNVCGYILANFWKIWLLLSQHLVALVDAVVAVVVVVVIALVTVLVVLVSSLLLLLSLTRILFCAKNHFLSNSFFACSLTWKQKNIKEREIKKERKKERERNQEREWVSMCYTERD